MGFFQDMMSKELEKIQQRAQKVADEVTAEVGKEADEYAIKSVVPLAESELKSAYHNSAAAWYNAYSPKKYQRSFSLYNALLFDNEGGTAIGWKFDDSIMNKRSWRGGTYNIYSLVFEGGAHGGPVHGRSPVSTTPIPVMFDVEVVGIQKMLQDRINQYGQEYFASHFQQRFYERFSL